MCYALGAHIFLEGADIFALLPLIKKILDTPLVKVVVKTVTREKGVSRDKYSDLRWKSYAGIREEISI